MRVPTPCRLGQKAICKGKELKFVGFSWFNWSSGMEYTYSFNTGCKWTEYNFYTSKGKECNTFYDINDSLLCDKPLKEHDYPLKGKGYLSGIDMRDNKLYADIILTSKYLTHILVECKENGNFLRNGNVLFPPTPMWELEEKRKDLFLKSYKPDENETTTLFDFGLEM